MKKFIDTVIYIAFLIVIILILITSCAKTMELKLLTTIDISFIGEPSGITIDKDSNLIIVDDEGKICSLTKEGQTIKCTSIRGDLEGISAYDNEHNVYWVVKEGKKSRISGINHGTLKEHDELKDLKIAGFKSRKQKGLEGICIDKSGNIFAINEKKPKVFLEIKLNREKNKFEVMQFIKLDFAEDYSDLWPDQKDGRFWILSHESKKVFLWDLNTRKVLLSFRIPVKQAEGIAIDFGKKIIFIVCDNDAKLYLFRLPDKYSQLTK